MGEGGIRMKRIAIALLMVLAFVAPVKAGPHGGVSLGLDHYTGVMTADVSIEQKVVKGLFLGTSFTTDMTGMALKVFVPSGLPFAETFRLWAEYRFPGKVSVRVEDWCRHNFMGVDPPPLVPKWDSWGLTTTVKWEF